MRSARLRSGRAAWRFQNGSRTRRGGVRRRGHLRHPEAEDLAARARGAGAHAHQEGVGSALHQLEARFVGHHIADDEGDGEVLLELPEVDRRVLGRDVRAVVTVD